MVRTRTRGRPPLEGARFDCGRRKPTARPRDQAIWYRIRDEGTAFGLSPLHKSQLSRLGYLGELTDRQVEAGFRVAKIIQNFRRWHDRRSSPASPDFMRGARATAPDPTDPAVLEELERIEHSHVKRWLDLQHPKTGWIAVLPNLLDRRRTRDAIDKLCGNDEHLTWLELELVAPMLDYIAQCMHIPGPPEGKSIAITARRPRRPAADRTPIDKKAWFDTARQINPELSEGELNARWFEYQARVDQERIRRAKERRR